MKIKNLLRTSLDVAHNFLEITSRFLQCWPTSILNLSFYVRDLAKRCPTARGCHLHKNVTLIYQVTLAIID
jgi:hypothetical protein